MEPIIKVDNVSMCFNLSTEKHESLKEYLLAMVQGRLQYDEFYALKDVSLDIMPGDFYGLVANPPCSRPLRACTSPARAK